MMSKQTDKKIHEFFLVNPLTLNNILFSNQASKNKQILEILSNDNSSNLKKLYEIHSLIINKTIQESQKKEENENEKKDEEGKEDDKSVNVFNPSIYSSPIKQDLFDDKISSKIKEKILSSYSFPENRFEEIYENSMPTFSKQKNIEEKESKNDSDVDLSKAKHSFLKHINSAAERDIDDIRDLSIANLNNEKSYVNVRNRKSNSIYTVTKPSAFSKKIEKKRKERTEKQKEELEKLREKIEQQSPSHLRSGIKYKVTNKKSSDEKKKVEEKKSKKNSSFLENSATTRRQSNFNIQWARMQDFLLQID